MIAAIIFWTVIAINCLASSVVLVWVFYEFVWLNIKNYMERRKYNAKKDGLKIIKRWEKNRE